MNTEIRSLRKLSRLLTVAAFFAFITAFAFALIGERSASASPVVGFQAGRIMDDSVFTNKDSMTQPQIQQFLQARVPVCDTQGTQQSEFGGGTRAQWAAARGYSPPFTCLKDFTEGGRSASQIIYDVAQEFSINPQVLIVLLQKEQSLITDDWPIPGSSQYRTATGYGCPDTAACASQYFGLTNQLTWSGRMFRAIMNASPTWNTPYILGSNNVRWSPDFGNDCENPGGTRVTDTNDCDRDGNRTETYCGYGVVNIQNRSTQALYNYTPYQPNPGALAAGWGTAPCGAYGNRNFYLYFTSWFGPTNTKALIRTTSSSTLFFTDGRYKYNIPSMDIVSQYGYTTNDVDFVSQSYIDNIPFSPNSTQLNYFAKTDSDSDSDGADLYLISGGQRYRMTSGDQMVRFGAITTNISLLPSHVINRLSLNGNLSNFVRGADNFVYNIQNKQKSGIFQLALYTSLNSGGSVSQLSPFILSTLITTAPLIQGYIPMREADGKIWIASSTGWSYVGSTEVMDCLGITSRFTNFTATQATIGTQTAAASCTMTDPSSGISYLFDKTRKYQIRDAWGLTPTLSSTAALFSDKTTSVADDLSVFKNSVDGRLYTFENGSKRYVESMPVLSEIGQSTIGINAVSNGSLARIPNGHSRVESGRLFRDAQSGRIYVINRDSKIYITSMAIYNSYGFSNARLDSASSANLANYTSTAEPLQRFVTIGADTYLVDSSVRYRIPAAAVPHYGSPVGQSYNSGVYARTNVSTTPATRFIKSTNSAQLYLLENGTKRAVNSWVTFTSIGGTNNNITSLSNSYILSIPTSTDL